MSRLRERPRLFLAIVCASILSVLAVNSCKAGTRLAITIDDLPVHGAIPSETTREVVAEKIISVLKKHKIPGVYGFINAGLVEQKGVSDKVFQIWQASGYPFGNHTYLHADIDRVSAEEYNSEIDLGEKMLKALSGDQDWKIFRYPYLKEGANLEKRNLVRAHLKDRGYTIAQVSIDFKDWAWNDPYARCKDKNQSKSIKWLKKTYLANAADHLKRAQTLSKALFKRDISQILLLHVGGFDAEMLDALLTQYKKLGVSFIPLSQAVKDEAYLLDPGLAFENTTDFLMQVLASRNQSMKDVGMEPYSGFPEKKLEGLCR